MNTTTRKSASEFTGIRFVRAKRGFVIGALIAFAAPAAFGLGVRIPNQDPEAIARGNAFAATADDPAAIYYNPAGISQIGGDDAQLGILNYFGINATYTSPSGSETHSKFAMVPVPELYYTHALGDTPLTLGLGLYAPFGLADQWPDNSSFRSIAIKASLQYLTLNPVISWKASPALSLAVGPTLDYSEIDYDRGLAVPAGDNLEFKGRGYSAGFNAGVLWQPLDQWSFGATYRSFSTMDYRGNTTYSGAPPAATSANLTFPQTVSAGISFRPTTNWNAEVDVDWADWSSVHTLDLNGTRNIFGFDLSLPLWWHPSWFYEAGLTRYFDDGWFVSAGYFYSAETTSEGSFTPAVPDTDLHVGSLGFGHKGEHWHWAVAGQIIAGPQRVVSNSQPNGFTGQSANGSYQLIVPTLSASVGYHF